MAARAEWAELAANSVQGEKKVVDMQEMEENMARGMQEAVEVVN
jgi:hypothetical protein